MRYIHRELRASRGNRSATLSRLIENDPCCAECGTDLKWLSDWFDGVCQPVASDASQEDIEKQQAKRKAAQKMLAEHDFDWTASLAEVDHIKPIWAGGEDTEDNTQLLCQPCHKEKTKVESAQRSRAKRAARHWEKES